MEVVRWVNVLGIRDFKVNPGSLGELVAHAGLEFAF